MNKSRKEILGIKTSVDLSKIISIPGLFNTGIYKCRLLYSEEIHKIEFIPYMTRPVKSLKIIENNNIEYSHKFSNREELEFLFSLRGSCDDILVVKNNHVTDTSFSNIVFFDGIHWVTPSTPLLKGTQRAKLLFENKILERNIMPDDIRNFKRAKLINAMVEFDGENIDIERIVS